MAEIYSRMFDTDTLLAKTKSLNRLQKVLLREKKGFQTVLFKRCGAGLTAKEFEGLVRILADNHFCTCTLGERGGTTISLKQEANNAQH